MAQTSRSRRDEAPTARSLELRLQKAEESLVNEYKEVVAEFYKQGDKEAAMAMLQRLRELNPSMEGLKDKIAEMNEELLQENPTDIEIDVRKSWEPVGEVLEGKPFRIQASGEFKLTYTVSVGPDGLQTEKESKDFLPQAPLGSLIGIIASDGEAGKPFPVKSQLEMTPKKGGVLLMKVNVPEGTKCVGRLKVHVTGYIGPVPSPGR
ncbi:MAG: hypothetical protein KDA89_24925 [Planctomycetaceae bacterium]|nr:hypothetical protein [Planctomycetaceae bacterium]